MRRVFISTISLCLLTLLVSCRPSFESKSAGQIGCLPSEIKILGKDTDVGFTQTTETWIAACRGREYVCSEVHTSSYSGTSGSSTMRMSQVSCAERSAASPPATGTAPREKVIAAPSPTDPRERPLPETSPYSTKSPPVSAGGFAFESSRQKAKELCEAAGKVWSETSEGVGECGGTAEDIGFEASVALQFCGDAICTASVVHEMTSEMAESITSIRSALVEKYGPSNADDVRIPKDCLSDSNFAECVRTGRSRFNYAWSWKTGEKLKLRIRSREGKASPQIEILYSRLEPPVSGSDKSNRKSKVRPNASAL